MIKRINDLVCQPEQAYKLKELGVRQRSAFYFSYHVVGHTHSPKIGKLFTNIDFSASMEHYSVPCIMDLPNKPLIAAAFTLQDMLPVMDKIDMEKLKLPADIKEKINDIDFLFWSVGIRPEHFASIIILAIEQEVISVDEVNRFL